MRKCAFLRVSLLLLCTLITTLTFAQERRITGTVTDDKQIPLVGATVTVKGTKVATTTDAVGKFVLTVPASGRTLVITYVGMQPEEFALGSSNVISLSLTSSSNALTDVVVTGYGRSRRANLTSAQTTVSAKEIEKTVNTTIEQAIQGRSAGVYVTQNSGQPGGGISVNIRGISTISGN